MAPRKSQASQTLLTHSNNLATDIETRVTEDSLSKCYLQQDSPLFTVLPPELRNVIFEFATAPYDDPNHSYKDTDYYYRPGHHAKHRTDTALLSTCRLIWLETNHLPLQQASPTFWFQAEERRPDWTHQAKVPTGRYSLRHHRTEWISEAERLRRFMKCLTRKNVEDLREMRFMGQLCWLESNQLGHLLNRTTHIPERIVITVRHTDWWWWENDQALDMNKLWITKSVLHNSSVQRAKEVVLELETLEWKAEQLMGIIENIKKVCGDVEGWTLEERKDVETWSGPTRLGGREWLPYDLMTELKYNVFKLVWKRREEGSTL